MSKDLHDIDELFRAGLDGYEETPSAGVKEALDAALDKQDAEKYKKRFIIWKRTALLLLLLLAGFVLYESGIIKTENGHYTSKNTTADKNDVSANSNETINQDKNNPANSNNDGVAADNSITQKNNAEEKQNQQQANIIPGIPVVAGNSFTGNKIVSQKNNRQSKQINLFTQKQDRLFSTTSSPADKKTNAVAAYDTDLQTTEKSIVPLDERVSIAKAAEWLVKKISSVQPIIVSNSPLTANKANDLQKKKAKPFWMITPFVSYDQASYRLDSDDPSAITSIKFREAHEPSFSTGLLLTRQITPRFGLQSGLIYSNSAIGMKPQKTYAFRDPTGDVAYKYITSSGYAFIKPGFGPQPTVGDSLTTAEAKHTIEHISLPLAIKYTVLNSKKVSITPGAGVEANFITKANLEVDIEDQFNREIVVVRKLNGTKSFYWSFVADAEIKYKVNQKLSINVRPAYRTAISPITKNNVVETFPHSFGISAGVTIKF